MSDKHVYCTLSIRTLSYGAKQNKLGCEWSLLEENVRCVQNVENI